MKTGTHLRCMHCSVLHLMSTDVAAIQRPSGRLSYNTSAFESSLYIAATSRDFCNERLDVASMESSCQKVTRKDRFTLQ